MNFLRQFFPAESASPAPAAPSYSDGLRKNEELIERLKAIIRHLSDPIFAVEPDGSIFFFSNGAAFFLGLKPQQVEGRRFTVILPLEPREKLQQAFAKFVESGQKVQVELTYDERPLMLVLTPMHEPQTRNLLGAFVELKDLTDKKLLRQKQLDFVSIVSHELRTPVTSIKGYLDVVLAEAETLSTEHREFIKRAYLSNERQQKTIEKLLDLSNLERGNIDIRFADVPLEKIIGDTITYWNQAATDKSLSLKFEYPRFPVPMVRADEDLVRSVVNNLVENAIKYTEKGAITVRLSQKDGQVVTSIEDTGPGIDSQLQKRIFSKFIRGEHSLTESTQGSGLGLYLVKGFVNLMNGEVGFSSTSGVGSKFWFSLPVAQTDRSKRF